MSSGVTPVQPSGHTPGAQAAAASSSTSGSVSSSTSFKSLDQIKNQDRKFYNLMMLSMAQTICTQSQHKNEELRKMIQEGENNS